MALTPLNQMINKLDIVKMINLISALSSLTLFSTYTVLTFLCIQTGQIDALYYHEYFSVLNFLSPEFQPLPEKKSNNSMHSSILMSPIFIYTSLLAFL